MIDYNIGLVNHNDLSGSFFHLDRDDPTVGFPYDASSFFGHTYPATPMQPLSPPPSTPTSPLPSELDTLNLRLRLGSHLAQHLRHRLEEQYGYTSTVGISTTKLVSKLVGNVNKPRGQTTIVPPYDGEESNVVAFLDAHDIGKIPGIGFKLAQKLRQHVLQRPPVHDAGLVYGGTEENVSVSDVRHSLGMCAELLEGILGGPGSQKGIGAKIWDLMNGVDDAEVGKARVAPRQISIEDSYIRLDTVEEVKRELQMLAGSLLRRMRTDLTEDDDEADFPVDGAVGQVTIAVPGKRRWLAKPRNLRLTTRPRQARNPDGSRVRCFKRISRSAPLPGFIFSLSESVDALVDKLVNETLLPLFHRLHPEKSGWDLSLVNVAVTNMAETATDDRDGTGRDIGRMFKRQESVLKEWRVEDKDALSSDHDNGLHRDMMLRDKPEVMQRVRDDSPHCMDLEPLVESTPDGNEEEDSWDGEERSFDAGDVCGTCGTMMPTFAMAAHLRYHTLPD